MQSSPLSLIGSFSSYLYNFQASIVYPRNIAHFDILSEFRFIRVKAGLAAFVKTYKFVSALYMFCDVLPPLAGLSRAFQKHDIDFTVVKPLVAGTKAALMLFSLFQETASAACPKCFQSLKSLVYSIPLIIQVQQFKQHVYDKYLEALSQHITNRFPDVFAGGV